MGRKRKEIRRENGEGSFYFDKKNNRYKYTVTVYDEYGLTEKRQFYGKSKQICEEKAQAYLKKYSGEFNPLLYEYTIVDILEDYIEEQFSFNEIGENTYITKLENLQIIKNSKISQIRIVDLREAHIKAFLKSIVGYSQSVINKEYSLLKKALKLAKKRKIINDNIIETYEIRKPKSNHPTKKVQAFTQEEQILLQKALDEYKPQSNRGYYKNQFIIMLNTGMRCGEVNALKPTDIDFNKNVIHIRRTLTRDAHRKTVIGKTTKTYNSLRDVQMTNEVRAALKDAIKNMRPNENNLIFTSATGGTVSHTSSNDALYRLCEKYGLPHYGQHSLRHTFATRCIEYGIDAVVLSKWLGHKDIEVTLNTYVDVFNAKNNESFDIFERNAELLRQKQKSSINNE